MAAVQYDHTALVQLTVNMCGLRTALEHIKTCAMQTGVEAAHSLKGWPRGAQTTSCAILRGNLVA